MVQLDEFLTISHNNDSPQLNNDLPQFFCYDYVLIIIIHVLTISMTYLLHANNFQITQYQS